MNLRQQLAQLLSFILEYSILLETNLQVNNKAIILFTLLSQLLSLSYSIIPMNLQSENSEYFQIIAKIVRPHLFWKLSSYSYSVVLFIIAILIILSYIVTYVMFRDKIDQLKKKPIQQLLTFLNQIFDLWLINIILEILFIESNSLCIITAIIYILFLIFRLLFTKSQMFFSGNTFNYSNVTFLVFLSQLFNLIQIVLFVYLDLEFQQIQLYQCLFGIFINVSNLANIIVYSPYLNNTSGFISIALNFNNLIYNCYRIILYQNNKFIQYVEIFYLLSLPISFKISQNYMFITFIKLTQYQDNPYKIINIIVFLKQQFSYSKFRIFLENIISKGEKHQNVEPLRFACIQNQDIEEYYFKLSLKHQELIKDDIILHISLLLKLELYFSAFLYISKHQEIKRSFINDIKFQICSNKCREQLNYHMMVNNNIDNGNKEFEQAIKLYMELEAKNLELCRRVIKMLQQKILYLQQFDFDEFDLLYYNSNQLVNQLDDLLKYVIALYQIYPSNRIQNLLSFIYAELLNDFLSANKVFAQAALQDDKLYKTNSNLKLDFYSNKTAYVLVNLDNMQIIRSSSNAFDFFGVDKLILDDLIPNGIKEYHNAMVKNFIKTGKSKFFRSVQDGLLAHKGFSEDVSLMTEIIFERHQLNALMIVSVQEENQIVMVIDNLLRIVGMSSEFFDIVGGTADQIELIYGIPIDYVIPKFKILSQDPTIQQIQLRFLNRSKLFDFVSMLVHYKQKRNITELMDACWLDSSNYDVYTSHCKIYNNDDKYYIVRFNYLKNGTRRGSQSASRTITQKSFFQNNSNTNIITEIELDEQIEVALPYEESEAKYINDIVVLQNPDILLSNRESHHNEGEVFLFDEQLKDKKNLYQQMDRSQSALLQLQNTIQQQKFFSIEKAIEQESRSQEEESQDVQIEGRSSQISQLSGQKKAFYYNKYILVEKMGQASDNSQSQKLFIGITVIQFILFISLITLSLISSSTTLNEYLTDIDLLQIKYYLFQPLESFIVTRYTIINYNNQNTAGTLTKTQLNSYLVFPNSNLNLGFDDVQTNLAAILNRLTLQDFLGQYYNIYIYNNTNTGDLFNITMRTSLSILVNYQYTFKAAYKYDGKTVTDSPYIFYSYRNLLVLYNAFDNLNSQQYQQTLYRVDIDKDKELNMFFPFIILIIIIISIQIFWYLKTQGKIASLLSLMTFCEPYTIQKDIERMSNFVEEISKNNNVLFKYQFVIDKKEIQLKIQQKQQQSQITVKRLQYQKKNLQSKFGLCLILVQLLIFLGYAIIKYYLNVNYYTQFKPTAYFYQQITDLGTNVPTIYAMREVLYYRYRYPFYTSDDLAQILSQVQTCLKQIQTVTSYITTLQSSQFLFSSTFYNFISEIQDSNICNYLTEEMKNKSVELCKITLGGSFQSGLTTSLIYIYTNVYNAMQMNNFTNKTEDTIDELEGAFLISEVIKNVNTIMKDDLNTQTKSILFNIIILSILGLIYTGLSFIILFYIIMPILQKQYYLAKRYLYLIPQYTIFLDDTFERFARGIMQDQQIIA